jgi:hypothetical protein
MKSTELAKVTTRFDFSFGLGNKCRKIFAVRLPNSEVKFSHMMCGNCSETFGKFASFTSCRMKLGTVDQDDADIEWSLRPFMRSAKKRRV